jgi:Caspase domain
MKDRDGDEEDGSDEILIPGDYKESGQIVDDEIFQQFVTQVPPGVHVVAMIDCCHSGTAMDLPYVCNVGDGEIRPKDGYKPIPAAGAALVPKKKTDKATKKKDKGSKTKEKKSKATDKKAMPDEEAEPIAEETSKPSNKKGKKSKAPKKKVAKEEPREEHYEDEDLVETVEDENEDEEEVYEEVERPVEPKEKKRGIFGFLGRKKK